MNEIVTLILSFLLGLSGSGDANANYIDPVPPSLAIVEHAPLIRPIPSILALEEIYITILQGETPAIPETVTATYSDNSQVEVPVLWEPINKYTFETSGEYLFTGIVEDTLLLAQCHISVIPTRDLSLSIISDDKYLPDCITVNNNDNYTIPEHLALEIYDTLDHYKEVYDIQVGFKAISLNDYTTISYNADEAFSPASSIKAPYTLYTFKEISKGNVSFDDELTYHSYLWEKGCGVIRESEPGTKWRLDDVLYHTIHISDNTGYYMLREHCGTENYDAMLKELGCKVLNAYRPWSDMSPHDLSIIWNEIYNFSFTCEEGEILMDALINADFNFIKEGLNSYQKVAHKSGFNEKGQHDSALIFGNSDPSSLFSTNDYILVIMTKKAESYSVNRSLISSLANSIDEIMKDLTIVQNE